MTQKPQRKYLYKVRLPNGNEETRTAKFPQREGKTYTDGSVCIWRQI